MLYKKIILLLFLPLYSLSQIVNDPDLIAFYPFNGNGNDISSNAFHATLIGPSSYTTDRFGNLNSAFSFNGSSNYFLVNNVSSVFKPTTFPVSISVWVRIPVGYSGLFTFFKNDFQHDVYSGIRGIVIPDGRVSINLENGLSIGPPYRRTKIGTTNIKDGNWHLITCVIRGFNDMDIYIDCANDNGSYSGSATTLYYNPNNPGIIGAYDGTIGNTGLDYSLGDIDQLVFIKRELTFNEILDLYFDTIINVSGGTNICVGDSISLVASGSYSFLWSTGETTSEIIVSPTVTTTYTVLATDINACSQSESVVVNVYSPISPVIQNNSPVCEGQNIQFNASGGSTYYWEGPNGFTSTLQNPVIPNANPTHEGYYIVQVIDSNACAGSDSVLIVIHSSPMPEIQSNTPVCEGDTLILLTSTGGVVYGWTGPNSFTSNQQEIIMSNATVLNSGYYTVNVTNTFGCTGSDSINVTVNPFPIATASSNSPVCEGQSIQLNASGGSTYYWEGPNGFTSTLQNPVIPIAALADSGLYTVIVSNIPCSDTASVFVEVYPAPVVDAGLNQTITIGESIALNGSGGPPYAWHPAATLDDPTVPNPVATPLVTTTYTLTVINSYGCAATDVVTVTVLPLVGEVFVPNIFSPNNDGTNDIVYVYGPNIKSIRFFIYNRWGEKVFESFNQANGWDGTYKGQASQKGVYYYYLEAELWDNEIVTKKGNITLVR